MTSPTATPPSTTDRIEKLVQLDAPRSRVWRALTELSQFNAWFGIDLVGELAPGAMLTGKYAIKVWVETMQPETFYSFRWHPYAMDPNVDYSAEPTTLVTFTLTDDGTGTKLMIVESGFDAIPAARRTEAFAMNTKGWNGQAEKIRKYLAAEG